MRIAYFVLLVFAIVNFLIVAMSNLTGENIYKKYGKQLLNGFWKFLLVFIAFYVALIISGLN